jgi:hypothetical protein
MIPSWIASGIGVHARSLVERDDEPRADRRIEVQYQGPILRRQYRQRRQLRRRHEPERRDGEKSGAYVANGLADLRLLIPFHDDLPAVAQPDLVLPGAETPRTAGDEDGACAECQSTTKQVRHCR